MKLEQKKFNFFNSTHWFYMIFIWLCMLLSSATFAENRIDAERQNWEVYISRKNVKALLLSNDGKTLWVGTAGGLEKRDASTGELKQVYTKQNGLLYNEVWSILSDGNGGIWVGTYSSDKKVDAVTGMLLLSGGVAHLNSDGKWNMFVYNFNLPSKNIRSLFSDGQGGLWVGTLGGGLVHLKSDGNGEVFNKDNSGLPGNDVQPLLSDGSGGIWVGTHGGGLVHLKSDGNWDMFNTNNSDLPSNNVYFICSDGSGGLWVKTNIGLAHFNADGKLELFFNKYNKDNIYSVLSDGQGGVWVGTTNDGLIHLKSDGNSELLNKDNSELPDSWVSSLISDGQGGVWIGTWNNGLAHLKSDGTWDIFNDGDSNKLSYRVVESLLSDSQGGLWVGTYESGLIHLKSDGNYELFNKENSELPHNRVSSLLSDGSGGLWVGTLGGGLAHKKADGEWDVFNKDNSGLPENDVGTLLSDGSGGVWVGTLNSRLAHLKSDGNWMVDTTTHVQSLLSDGQNGLWVGSGFYLTHYKADGMRVSYSVQSVNSLLSDGQSGLWVGTLYDGLTHLKSDGNWDILNKENSALPDNLVASLLSDSSGGVWVGTWKGGLAHLKSDGNWDILNEENSALPYNNVASLLSDGSGGVWVGTFGGGLAHLLQLGSPEQLIKPNSSEITINWFLKSSSLDFQNVKYIELQRALSQDGVYETVLDESDKPVRFHADYSICPKPRVDGCWVTVEGHTPETRTNSDGSTTKGYTLNTPIEDPEWLEGLPRYYRLSAVIEEYGKLVRVANNSEAALITPQVEEKPRFELTLDRNAIAMQPNQKVEITVFVSSLDLFRGDVTLEIESGDGVVISDNTNTANGRIVETHDRASLRGSNRSEKGLSSTISLKAGETKPVLLTIEALSENTQSIKIIPKIQSGYSGKSTSLNVQVGDGTNSMIALSIAHKTKRTRVLDSLTIAGNVIPAQAGQSVVISGNNIKKSVDSSNSFESADSNESLTLTTDENGYFQGSVTPIHAGLLTLTANANGITSNNAEIFILPAKTNIALSSNVNQSTQKGDILRVQGIITPVRLDGTSANEKEIDTTKVNFDIRYLDPANQDAGLQPQFVGGVEIDANGVFYRDVVVPGNGFINVKASLPETSDYLSVNTKLVIPIGQPVGEGIIVVSESGGGIEGAFAEANYEVLKFYRHTQRPIMDADGDGFGTTNFDRYEASGKFIEYRPSGNLRPQIRTTNPDLTINRGDLENNFLWAIATDPENEMQGVFCSITDPSNKTVNIEMKLDTGNVYKTDLKQNYPNLSTGCYQAVYYAKDKAGNVSLPEQKFLNVISSSGVLPQAPQMKITTQGNIVTVSWLEVTNAYGYRLFYAPYPTPNPSDIGEIDMGNQRTITFDGKGFAFYGAVKAYNSNGLSGLSNIEFFDLI